MFSIALRLLNRRNDLFLLNIYSNSKSRLDILVHFIKVETCCDQFLHDLKIAANDRPNQRSIAFRIRSNKSRITGIFGDILIKN